MRHNARFLVDGGHTRPTIRLADATDVLWTYSSPELFDLLVQRRHWSLRQLRWLLSGGHIRERNRLMRCFG